MLTIKDFSKLYALLFVKKQCRKSIQKRNKKKRSVAREAGGAFAARGGKAIDEPDISKVFVCLFSLYVLIFDVDSYSTV